MKPPLPFFFGFVLVVGGCQQRSDPTATTPGEYDAAGEIPTLTFARLKARLPVIVPPVRYALSADAPTNIALHPLEQRLLADDPNAESGVAVGILPDTTQVFHILWLAAADSWLPVISTFSRSGELLKVQGLIIGECAPWTEPCFSCKETMIIDTNYHVLTTDTVKDCECDSTYMVIGPCKHYVKILEGIVTSRGTIMSPVRRSELRSE